MLNLKKLLILLAVVATIVGCSKSQDQSFNSIYHWKTTFEVGYGECEFLAKHNIVRIYLHMFDVVVEQNHNVGTTEIVPIATTKFVGSAPKSVEIVPTIYITIDALRAMTGKESEYATLIVERALAMCSYNECGKIKELQLDCDWTSTTKQSYNLLCSSTRELLRKEGIDLSATIRLHQLSESAPPVDRGVLMLYNTGAIKNPKTKNSILDIKDVEPCLNIRKYHLPLSYAYPAFGWGVKFQGGEFRAITKEDAPIADGEQLRNERPTSTEILAVKALVENKLGKPTGGNIIYHLDLSQLNNYTDDEIAQILAH